MDLDELRRKIDTSDMEILKLLNARMEFALRTKRFKDNVSDASRESGLLQNIKKHSSGLIRPEFSEKLFGEIVSESKKLQEKYSVLAAFQGEHGAYSEIAVRNFDPSAVPIGCTEFGDVFGGVENGYFDIGMVPVENSIEGAVTQVNDLLVGTTLRIIGEVVVPVHHCLLVVPGTDYRDIKVVYSHPQALGQCGGFISRNKLEPRPYYDTAGAAAMLSRDRPTAAAAIANRLCAELYGLEVLKENIEDHESNSTRFLVLSKGKGRQAQKGNKCSIIFSTSHKAGALFLVLRVFSDAGINLTRIESRPVRGEPQKYAFLLDLQGSDEDRKISDALAKVEQECTMYKFLGCYREAKSG